jgi:hypothetical protein
VEEAIEDAAKQRAGVADSVHLWQQDGQLRVNSVGEQAALAPP